MITEGKARRCWICACPACNRRDWPPERVPTSWPSPRRWRRQRIGRHWASSHNTLGELLGRATHDAVTRCLLLQNGLCPELRRTICGALSRHGCDKPPCALVPRPNSTPVWRNCSLANFRRCCMTCRAPPPRMVWPKAWDLARAGIVTPGSGAGSDSQSGRATRRDGGGEAGAIREFREVLRGWRDAEPGALAALAVVRGFARKWN